MWTISSAWSSSSIRYIYRMFLKCTTPQQGGIRCTKTTKHVSVHMCPCVFRFQALVDIKKIRAERVKRQSSRCRAPSMNPPVSCRNMLLFNMQRDVTSVAVTVELMLCAQHGKRIHVHLNGWKHIMFGHAYVDLFTECVPYQDTFRSRRIPDRKPLYSTDGKGYIPIRGWRTSETNDRFETKLKDRLLNEVAAHRRTTMRRIAYVEQAAHSSVTTASLPTAANARHIPKRLTPEDRIFVGGSCSNMPVLLSFCPWFCW